MKLFCGCAILGVEPIAYAVNETKFSSDSGFYDCQAPGILSTDLETDPQTMMSFDPTLEEEINHSSSKLPSWGRNNIIICVIIKMENILWTSEWPYKIGNIFSFNKFLFLCSQNSFMCCLNSRDDILLFPSYISTSTKTFKTATIHIIHLNIVSFPMSLINNRINNCQTNMFVYKENE